MIEQILLTVILFSAILSNRMLNKKIINIIEYGILPAIFAGLVKYLIKNFSNIRKIISVPSKMLSDYFHKNILRKCRKRCSSKELYKYIYKGALKELVIHTTTWPVFGEKEEIILKKLVSNGKRVVVYGPLDETYTLPGFFWRLYIFQETIYENINLLHIKEDSIPFNHKYIIVDNHIFWAEKGVRVKHYYRLNQGFPSKIKKIKLDLLRNVTIYGNDGILYVLHKHIIPVYLKLKGEVNQNCPGYAVQIDTLTDQLYREFEQSVHKNGSISVLGKEHFKVKKERFKELLKRGIIIMVDLLNEKYNLNLRLYGENECIEIPNNIRKETKKIFMNTINEIKKDFPLPKVRIVLTESCNLDCIYCPEGNEGLIKVNKIDNVSISQFSIKDILYIIKTAHSNGFKEFVFTGGEPLLHDLFDPKSDNFINFVGDLKNSGILKDKVTFYISTNGTMISRLNNLISIFKNKELKEYKQKFKFKLSMDGVCRDDAKIKNIFEYYKLKSDVIIEKLSMPHIPNCKDKDKELMRHYPKISHFNTILASTINLLENGFSVGINYILTKSNSSHLLILAHVLFDLINAKKEAYNGKLYLKILDLNWHLTSISRKKSLSFTSYWQDNYLSPYVFYKKHLQEFFGPPKHTAILSTGISVLEMYKEGFKIRIKDSAIGTHFLQPTCSECVYFLSRRCQEGLYQPWVVPSFSHDNKYSIKLCSLNNQKLIGGLRENGMGTSLGNMLSYLHRLYKEQRVNNLQLEWTDFVPML